ncbi:unnamed protein product, partial [Lampetra planeri]
MERNIGDQLNKAFEAYRQVSIEKDNAKKELQQMVMTYQRFSMPIQCTDRTAEAEAPFSSALRSAVDIPVPPASLASRGASPEDRDFVDSLTKLSVKFPPSADSDYDFLNSAPDRRVGLTLPVRRPLSSVPAAGAGEEPVDVQVPFVYPTFPSHSTSPSLSQESVRGPQQSLWSPELVDASDMGAQPATPQSSSPDKLRFLQRRGSPGAHEQPPVLPLLPEERSGPV